MYIIGIGIGKWLVRLKKKKKISGLEQKREKKYEFGPKKEGDRRFGIKKKIMLKTHKKTDYRRF